MDNATFVRCLENSISKHPVTWEFTEKGAQVLWLEDAGTLLMVSYPFLENQGEAYFPKSGGLGKWMARFDAVKREAHFRGQACWNEMIDLVLQKTAEQTDRPYIIAFPPGLIGRSYYYKYWLQRGLEDALVPTLLSMDRRLLTTPQVNDLKGVIYNKDGPTTLIHFNGVVEI